MAGLSGLNPTRTGAWGGPTPLAYPQAPLRAIPAPHTEGAAPLTPKPRHAKVAAAAAAATGVAAGASAAPEKKKAASSKAAPKASPASASCSSSWPCKGGHLVRILQEQSGAAHQLTIQVSAARLPPGVQPELHWGVYRSAPDQWRHPEALTPPGSYLDPGTGGMRSPMTRSPDGSQWGITMAVPAGLAPITLAFVLHLTPAEGAAAATAGAPQYITPLQGRHFSALVGLGAGSPTHLGPSLVSETADGATVNFAVRSRGGERVSLAVLKPPAPGGGEGKWGSMEVSLDPVVNRTGDTWHVALSGLKGLEGLVYGWRVDGDVSWEAGSRLQPDQLLLDPQASRLAYLPAQPPPPMPMPTLNGGATIAASSLAGLRPGGGLPAGQIQGPRRGLEEVRMLEVDVRTFASGKGVAHPGTFLGVAERLEHILAVGANAVLLGPCYATSEGIGSLSRAAVSHFAPDPELSSDPADPAAAPRELHAMVAALHAAGVEVLLTLDLTFTAEGTDAAPHTLGLRGLDHSTYYRANGVLNAGHAVVRQYTLDAARRWASDYGVDGFAFANAENLVQDRDGSVLDAPPLAEELCLDPVLGALRLLAMPADDALLPRGGERGFPHWGLWQQRNQGFARDMVAWVAEGTPGLAGAVAARLSGSAAVFAARWDAGLPGNLATGRRPSFGFNAVSVLGQLSLREVAAEAAEMAAAAAAATFGPGAAAPASPATIAKTLLVAAILAQGTPLLSQDSVADMEMARFVGVLMRLRKRLAPLLLPPVFDAPRDVAWHGAGAGSEPDWGGAAAAEGHGAASYLATSVRSAEGAAVYIGFNPHIHAVDAALPPAPPGHTWARVVDTSLPAPDDAALEGGELVQGGSIWVAPKASVVLLAAIVETVA